MVALLGSCVPIACERDWTLQFCSRAIGGGQAPERWTRALDSDNVSGIILAGGTSSRLGQDKALLRIAGLSLIERVVGRIRKVVTEIVVVTNDPDRYAFLGEIEMI